jgi:Uncharacterised nucleotidyltransferase
VRRVEARSNAAVDELVLLVASTRAHREANRVRSAQLADDVDWRELASTLAQRRLMSTLGPRLVSLAEARGQAGFADEAESAVQSARRHAASMQTVAEMVRARLAGSGIRASQLKGPALGQALYGDLGRRHSRDIDLLVDPQQLADAVDVALGLDYEAPRDATDATGLPLLHFAMPHARGALPPLELHWRVHWYEGLFAQERLLIPPDADAETWRPAAVDQLAALLLFYARDGFMNLRHAIDLGAFWDRAGDRIPDGALGELALHYPALGDVLAVSAVVAQRSLGIEATRLSSADARLGARGRLAARLALPRSVDNEAQIYADMGLIDGLLAPRSDLGGFVRRQLLPSGRLVRERRASGAAGPGGTSLGHCLRTVVRYGVSLAGVFRGATPCQPPAGSR